VLGYYVDSDFIIPMIIDHISNSESQSVPYFVSSSLIIFSQVVRYTTHNFSTLGKHMEKIIDLLSSSDFLQSDQTNVLEAVLELTSNCILSIGKQSETFKVKLFKILLQLGSVPGTQHLSVSQYLTVGHGRRIYQSFGQ
jgi:hypothetical protein